MTEKRSGEESGTKTYYRSDRFYSEEGGWFAKLREGEELGPFDSKDEAKQALADFIELYKNESPEA
ncbi:MAG: hypothetical protein KUG83_10040 [Gammaproteobacteria bacterium]|nr:hypothetical protein [Gammaproteobacteria bacterium]